MVIQETISIKGNHFDYFYSDEGVKIVQDQTGILFNSAVDIAPSPYTYSESNIPLDSDSDPE